MTALDNIKINGIEEKTALPLLSGNVIFEWVQGVPLLNDPDGFNGPKGPSKGLMNPVHIFMENSGRCVNIYC